MGSVDYGPPVGVVGVEEGHNRSLPVHSLPKEMTYPVPKGERFGDRYDYVRFPESSNQTISAVKKEQSMPLLYPGDKKMEGKTNVPQSLISNKKMAEAVRTESKPPLVVRETKGADGKAVFHAGNRKGLGAGGVASQKQAKEHSKLHLLRGSDVTGMRSRRNTRAERSKMEHVRKAWGIPQASVRDKEGAVHGVSPSVVGGNNKVGYRIGQRDGKDVGDDPIVGQKADGVRSIPSIAVEVRVLIRRGPFCLVWFMETS